MNTAYRYEPPARFLTRPCVEAFVESFRYNTLDRDPLNWHKTADLVGITGQTYGTATKVASVLEKVGVLEKARREGRGGKGVYYRFTPRCKSTFRTMRELARND